MRNDGADRRAFRKDFYESVNTPGSPLEALGNAAGGEHQWRAGVIGNDGKALYYGKPGFHSNEGRAPGWVDTQVDAGHVHSSESGERLYAAEERSQNRIDGASIERSGTIMEKPAIEVDGLSVNRNTAQKLEDRGVLKEGTVESAPRIEGWAKDEGIIRSEPVSANNNQTHQHMPEMSNQPKIAPTTGPSPSSTGDSEKPTPPPDLSKESFPSREEFFKQNPQPAPAAERGPEPSR